MNGYFEAYEELANISKDILPYYDVDKVKPYAVYVWGGIGLWFKRKPF